MPSLDAALELIALDAGRRGELRRQARAAHAARFSVDGHLERYLSLIATLARERGDRSGLGSRGGRDPRGTCWPADRVGSLMSALILTYHAIERGPPTACIEPACSAGTST